MLVFLKTGVVLDCETFRNYCAILIELCVPASMQSVRGPVKSFDFSLKFCVFYFFTGSQIIK